MVEEPDSSRERDESGITCIGRDDIETRSIGVIDSLSEHRKDGLPIGKVVGLGTVWCGLSDTKDIGEVVNLVQNERNGGQAVVDADGKEVSIAS
jgi:hypothetical protein